MPAVAIRTAATPKRHRLPITPMTTKFTPPVSHRLTANSNRLVAVRCSLPVEKIWAKPSCQVGDAFSLSRKSNTVSISSQ